MKSRIPKAEQGRIRNSQRPGTGLEVISLQKPPKAKHFLWIAGPANVFLLFRERSINLRQQCACSVRGGKLGGALQVAGGQITFKKGVTAL